MIKKFVALYRMKARKKRQLIFKNNFLVSYDTKILDLGSENGTAIHAVLEGLEYTPENIFIADIEEESVTQGAEKYGFTPVHISEDGPLNYPDGFFDIVYCSSVIEHVTVPKGEMYAINSGAEFKKKASFHQQQFAEEIRRLGKNYFVQTPNKWFLFESHSWLPFVGWMPRQMQIATINLFNKFWIKKTYPDFLLLGKKEFGAFFPFAEIMPEKSMGMVKSWMAIKK